MRLRDQGCARVERHYARLLATFYDRLLESDHQRYVSSRDLETETTFCAPAAYLLPIGTRRRAEAARERDQLHGEQLLGARKRLIIDDPVR